MNFTNSYASLDEDFYEIDQPTPVRDPQLFLWNSSLAKQLLIPDELSQDSAALAQIFSGNQILPGSEPIATAYAGHQFGYFVPQLGDGRAHLLGELTDQSGQIWDLQLKGSGPTSFSRDGDGRCALGPAVREYIMSEAMAALGVPTTRCLAVVTTGEPVLRGTPLTGAIVTRVATSHVRIGTFQYFAAKGNHKALKDLCDYTIRRHYPELAEEGPNRYALLLDRFAQRFIRLIVEWMRIGFIHGVMNTDNTALSGETIDYGPCSMLGIYDPQTVYSSIDSMGRYAFGRQPNIAHWNLARLAECLLPLINSDSNRAKDQLDPIVAEFPNNFRQAYENMLGRKLGIASLEQQDQALLYSILDQLLERRMDYTISFDLLTKSLTDSAAAEQISSQLGNSYDLWRERLGEQQVTSVETQQLMRSHNPVVIPRNHHIEAVIRASERTGDAESAERILKVLRYPYQELADTSHYQDPPSDGDEHYQTFCGT